MNLIILFSMLLNLSFSQVRFEPDTSAVFYYCYGYDVLSCTAAYYSPKHVMELGSFNNNSRLQILNIELFPKANTLAFKSDREKKLIYMCQNFTIGAPNLRIGGLFVGDTDLEIQKKFKEIIKYTRESSGVVSIQEESILCTNVNDYETPTADMSEDVSLEDTIDGFLVSIGQFYSKKQYLSLN